MPMSDRLHDEELPIKPNLVPALADDAAPQWSRLPLTPLDSTGAIHRLFRLGDELMVRFPRAARGERQHRQGRAVDLIVAWQLLDRAGREVFRAALGVDDSTWLRGRAWALGISLMVWYYWQTMPQRRPIR